MLPLQCACGRKVQRPENPTQIPKCPGCGRAIPLPAPPARGDTARIAAPARPADSAKWGLIAAGLLLFVSIGAGAAALLQSGKAARAEQARDELTRECERLKQEAGARDRATAGLRDEMDKSQTDTLAKIGELTRKAELLERERGRLATDLGIAQGRNEELARQLEEARRGDTTQKPKEEPPKEKEKDKGIAELVEKFSGGVVLIRTDVGSGTGFFIAGDGVLVTNYHVITGSRRITVEYMALVGGRKQRYSIPAEAIAADMKNDLALVRPLSAIAVPVVLELATDDSVRAGDPVFAIGNPGMGDVILEQSVSNGIVSNLSRVLDGTRYLQTTAAINPGNSGGPLFSMAGKVIGVVSAKAREAENVGFAVPASYVRALFEQRDGAFRIQGSLSDFEKKSGLKFNYDDSQSIPVKTTLSRMILDEEHNRILAIDYDNNSLLVVSLSDKKVIASIFVGSEPSDMTLSPAGHVWIVNAASKNLIRVDLEKQKIAETIQLGFMPWSLKMTSTTAWCTDRNGSLYFVSVSEKKDYPVGRSCMALGYASRTDKFIGADYGGMVEFDPDKVIPFVKELSRMKPNDKQRPQVYQALEKCFKRTQSPLGGSRSNTILLVDEKNGRIVYNRAILKLDRLDAIQGVFKPNPYSLSSDPAVRTFMARYPYLDEIMAISPDGKWAANGTHVFSAATFTVAKEIPVPTICLAFSRDSKTLYFFDGLNRTIVPFEVEK